VEFGRKDVSSVNLYVFVVAANADSGSTKSSGRHNFSISPFAMEWCCVYFKTTYNIFFRTHSCK
jgi:hypothetical protein